MNRIRLFLGLFILIAVFSALLFFLVVLLLQSGLPEVPELQTESLQTESFTESIHKNASEDHPSQVPPALSQDQTEAVAQAETEEAALSEEARDTGQPLIMPDPSALTETDIYTFLQGPKSWESRIDWSGSWCNKILADQTFGAFGCGLCDLANIYGTLTPYDCSPIDMYYFAQEASGYAPVSGVGAIDWPDLRKTLRAVGIESRLKRKNRTYEQFRDAIAEGITAIALVCSDYDSTYWENVSGHYVNIWLYDPEDETVFLGDSGNPDHNRQRIPLRYVYDALKTSSRYQYLLVTSASEEGNTWKHDGIRIRWKKPRYYR